MLLLLAVCGAQAQDPDELDIDIKSSDRTKDTPDGFVVSKDPKLATADEDDTMLDFVAEAKKKAPPPVHFHLDPLGKEPLKDHFDIQTSAFNELWVAVELPVLVAKDRASFLAAHPGGVTVIGEVTAGNTRLVLTEIVRPESVYEAAPTLIFLKTALPTAANTGDVRFLVKVAELPAPPLPDAKPAATPPVPPPPRELFARTTVWRKL